VAPSIRRRPDGDLTLDGDFKVGGAGPERKPDPAS
jgi:hypothetical protein